MRIGLHLLRRGRTFFFRCRLPVELATKTGRREIVRTLETRNAAVARARAGGLALGLDELWVRLRVAVSREEIEKALDAWFEEECARAFRLYGKQTFAEALVPADCSHQEVLTITQDLIRQDAENQIEFLGETYRRGDFSVGRSGARNVIARLSEAVDDGDQMFAVICKAVTEALGQLEEGRIKWVAGEVEHHPRRPSESVAAPPVGSASPAISISTDDAPVLRERIDTYLALKRSDGRLTEKQLAQLTSELRVMASAIGDDTPVSAITNRHAGQLYEGLQFLPPRFGEHEKLRDLEFAAMVARAREMSLPALNKRTVNGYLSSMRAFFEQEKKAGYVSTNPFAGQHVKTASPGESERGFTRPELSLILSNPLFMGAKSPARPYEAGPILIGNWQFWSALIAMFTGARISEIAQLRPDDVCQIEDVWVFDINARDGKRLKNPGTARRTPVHSELIRIGLLDLAARQARGERLALLPELPQPVGGDPGKQLSKWMSEKFLPRLRIDRAGGGFHSFRHALRTMMREAKIDSEVMDRIDGHKTPGVGAIYGKHSLKTLAEALESVIFPDEVKWIAPRN